MSKQASYQGLRHEAGVAATVHAVAAVYAERGDLALAEERYQRALAIRRERKDERGIAATLNDLGCIWMMQQRTEEAIPMWEEGAEIAQNTGERAAEATIRDSWGEGLMNLGRYDEAQKQLEEAIQVARAIGNIRVQAHSCLNLSKVYSTETNEISRNGLSRSKRSNGTTPTPSSGPCSSRQR